MKNPASPRLTDRTRSNALALMFAFRAPPRAGVGVSVLARPAAPSPRNGRGGCRPHSLRRVGNRFDNTLIAGAPAEMTRQRYPDFVGARAGTLAQECEGRHQKSRGAEAALQPMVIPERFLYRMQPVRRAQRLHGHDLLIGSLHAEHQA